MKGNSDFIFPSATNSLLWNSNLRPGFLDNKSHYNLSPEIESPNIGNKNFWNLFWNKLVYEPLSFSQDPNTNIFNILEEDIVNLASDSLRSVLSKKLDLSMSSEELTKAIENSNKIFHEDFPYDFILEYKGDRLGMMLLDKCFNSMGEAKHKYKFDPHIINFQGLF